MEIGVVLMLQKVNSPRILVAKHIPDIRRNEPRNIGVVLWTKNGIAARFAGEREAEPRHVVRGALKQWRDYWRLQIEKSEMRCMNGSVVSASDPEFVDRLIETSKTQFKLVDSGVILDDIDDIKDVTDQLFADLVATPKTDADSAESRRELQRLSRQAVRDSGLRSMPGFKAPYDFVCTINDAPVPFKFTYAVHTDSPRLLINRIGWRADPIYSSAFKFQQMATAFETLSDKTCISLVHANEEQLGMDKVKDLTQMLNSCSTVVNVADPEHATHQLSVARALIS